MKLFPLIVYLVSMASALPSPIDQTEAGAVTGDAAYVVPNKGASCTVGVKYCYEQIVKDLGIDKQNILHQYCAQQSNYDAQSCHACTRPWPLPYCWDGPGAWNSVFECKGEQNFTFKTRCNWCSAGKCV